MNWTWKFLVSTLFDHRDFFGIFWGSPRFLANPRNRDFSRLEIFIPGIRDFSWFRDFFPGIYVNSPGFLLPGFGIFSSFLSSGCPGDFSSSGSGFFRGMGYPDKKPCVFKNKLPGQKTKFTILSFAGKLKFSNISLDINWTG